MKISLHTELSLHPPSIHHHLAAPHRTACPSSSHCFLHLGIYTIPIEVKPSTSLPNQYQSHNHHPPISSIMASLKPPFTAATARQKVKFAQAMWNTRDPGICMILPSPTSHFPHHPPSTNPSPSYLVRISAGYTPTCIWRNRSTFLSGTDAIIAFLTNVCASALPPFPPSSLTHPEIPQRTLLHSAQRALLLHGPQDRSAVLVRVSRRIRQI